MTLVIMHLYAPTHVFVILELVMDEDSKT